MRYKHLPLEETRMVGVLVVVYVIVLALCFFIPEKLFETNEKLANSILALLLIYIPFTVMIIYGLYEFFIE